ncbi:hypothetical protein ACFFJI_12025 [Allobacillus sp. GCM10007491]|uniref:Uncharacterized protein n=2 Tax=Allobacillus TaxID=1400133 RepID=A0A941CTF3_9BACI|nr:MULTISPECIES: hypothetical protein [Allobacillus]MBR7553497.1 hypothetical protein [Allobacillus saliphilus]TSJ65332.1 hypothetical protein FPQ13_07130 [Allobacillus salarius]
MSNKNKVFLVFGIFLLGLIIVIVTATYFGLQKDPERTEEVKVKAADYLDKHFTDEMEIVEVMYDNASIYEQFSYAAIVQPVNNPDFQFLVYPHRKTGEYTDSYVAEVWEDELEEFLMPRLKDKFGQNVIKELWLTYPKDIGDQLNISHDDIPSLKGQDTGVVIRLTLSRGEKDNDEEALEELLNEMKNELSIERGHFTLSFSEKSLFLKDKNINKNF